MGEGTEPFKEGDKWELWVSGEWGQEDKSLENQLEPGSRLNQEV